MKSAFVSGPCAAALCLAFGCQNEEHASKPLLFDQNVRAAYAPARACRVLGEHSGLGAYSVWISKDAASEYAAIWQNPPSVQRLPPGTVVVKEIYTGTNCDASEVARWVAIRKEPGFDPPHADWHWQEVTTPNDIVVDGIANDCISCHEGTGSCSGYGETAGRDYLCTAP